MLPCQRHLFSLPEDVHYLNCAYMSPLLREVENAAIESVQKKRLPSNISGVEFFDIPRQTRELFAELVHAPSYHTISIIPAVSYGMAIAANNIRLQKGQNIVAVAEEFPSNIYAWRKHIQHGVELNLIQPLPVHSVKNNTSNTNTTITRAELWNEAILQSINENTGVVVICPVHWTDGTIFDMKRIAHKTRQVGAVLIVDGTQTLGAMPFDVEDIKPDALIAASYKSMMGLYSLGFAYWGEYFHNAEPLEETWIGRKGSEDLRNLVDYQDEYQEGMARLNVGQASNFALLPAVNAALLRLLEWQPCRVQEYCAQLNQTIVTELSNTPFVVEPSPSRAEHLFGICIPEALDVQQLQSSLQEHNVVVSLRGQYIRVSPNVYNTERDIEKLLNVLCSL